MVYLDTNVLIYACINQDDAKKMAKSQSIVRDLFETQDLILSPISIQELIYTLSRLNISSQQINDNYRFFKQFCVYGINVDIIDSAVELSLKLNLGKNINDIIHLKYAENYCSKLITFDNDFKKLKEISSIEIQILE